MNITSTKQAAALNGVKMLVHANSGAGKTYLCSTLPNPIIISAEAGLLSLSEFDLPVIQVNNVQDVREAYKFLATSDDAKQYESVALDSISEIAEVVLSFEKKQNKDGRMAYMILNEVMTDLIRAFRDLPKHVYFSAKMERARDELSGMMLFTPSMPGSKLAQQLPYFFDFVFALRTERDEENNVRRYLQTVSDAQYMGKDRSGKLDQFVEPDLGKIIKEVLG